MLTLSKLADEVSPYHNDICLLYHHELVRLVGVGEDEYDLYYVVEYPEAGIDKQVYASAVGHLDSLKNILPTKMYEGINRHFELNGCPSKEEFLILDKRNKKET